MFASAAIGKRKASSASSLASSASGSNLVVAVPTPSLSVPPTNMQEVTPCQSGVATSSDRPTTAPSNSKDLPADASLQTGSPQEIVATENEQITEQEYDTGFKTESLLSVTENILQDISDFIGEDHYKDLNDILPQSFGRVTMTTADDNRSVFSSTSSSDSEYDSYSESSFSDSEEEPPPPPPLLPTPPPPEEDDDWEPGPPTIH